MSACVSPVVSAKLAKIERLSFICSMFSGSLNWHRMQEADADVVAAARASLRSTITGLKPARLSQKALAAPTMPPPTITISADAGSSLGWRCDKMTNLRGDRARLFGGLYGGGA